MRSTGFDKAMRRFTQLVLIIASFACSAGAGFAQEEVQNDDFDGTGVVFAQAGQAIGDILAVRLIPATPCPCRITGIKWLLSPHPIINPFNDPPAMGRFLIKIWEDPGGSADPGAFVFEAGVEEFSSTSLFILSDFTSETVIVNGPFRVGFEMFLPDDIGNPAFLPSEGYTVGSGGEIVFGEITPERNTIYQPGPDEWTYAEDEGVTGDFIIRAIVEPAPALVPLSGLYMGSALALAFGGIGAMRLRGRRRAE